jgi:hypothetical protein
LDEYVKSGGSLLVNTGWQYSSADWKVSKTPDFLPLMTLEWLDSGTGDYVFEKSDIVENIDITKLGPLIYDNRGWNISSSSKTNLRDWAKAVISVNDKPLIAGGQYGSGRVVWMGLDLPGHLGAYQDNEQEIALYKKLMSYLLDGKEGTDLKAGFTRDYPDRLEITINESSDQKTAVYWSEAYYPDFKAKLIEDGKSKKIAVYRAGPGMTLFILPSVKAGSKIIYEYKTPILITVARLTSLLTLLIMTFMLIRPQLLKHLMEKFFDKIKKGSLSEIIFWSHNDENSDY